MTPSTRNSVQTSYYVAPGTEDTGMSVAIIMQACADAMGVQKKGICSRSRKEKVKFARWFVWRILLSHGYTNKEAGMLTGGHDHSTVVVAAQKLPGDIEKMPMVAEGWDKVKMYVRYGQDTTRGKQ